MSKHLIQDSDTKETINSLLNCARSCLEAFHYCLDEKGTSFSGKHLSLLQLCADTCQTTMRLLVSDLPFYHQACELAFEMTQACAVECEKYEYDDVFKIAAADCRRAAENCKRMTGLSVRLPVKETYKIPVRQ